ncbi:MAG TPA: non-homologous end-joining DNA ligase, partial [Flavisolibacter sp.]|nr:non-homologous end-joining DNA ligase [Flavisolibacter sp.]
MSLSLYNQKRHFNKTAEPKGVTKASKGALKFVIQKHDATNLHYDLRLEMEGVLKSWAVPKGPSLNPADKRLAMAVEDHPFDYRNFEGIIPAGEYGGGTVIVWDEGTYTPIGGEDLSKKEQEKLLLKQLKAGDLKLNFTGHKVNGTFALFQMKGRGENTWLLVKKKDEYATEEDITQQDESVKSGKSLAEIAEENGTTLNHPEVAKSSSGAKKTLKKISPAKTKKSFSKSSIDLEAVAGDSISLLKKTPFPKVFKPMLATLVDEPFDDEGWIYEVKWDGYRAVAYCNGKDVALVSRNGNAFTDKYFPITQALQQLKIKAVFDGEVVAVNEDGLPDFQALQNCENTPTHLQYYIFDIIWLDGNDLTMLPLIERKKILEKLLPGDDAVLKYSDHVAGKGNEFFEIALAKGLEGIMGKKADSTYKIGTRNDDWVKIKVNQRQEVVIAGFTKPRNTRQFFGALLLGVYDGNELKYVGHTGGGFNTQSLEQIHKKLQPLITNESPFKVKPKTNQPATWVKPELVC